MKKILFASSALVAVAAAGTAQASEPIQLSVGGYMEQWAGFADEDNTAAGGRKNAFQSDTEVHFSGSTTLDNGIEVGAKIELEGEEADGAQVDEQYLYVNGGFGQVKLGQEDGVQTDMLTVAPSTGPVNAQDGDLGNWVSLSDASITAPSVGPVGVNDGDMSNWVDAYLIDTVRSSGDQKRVTYYTPVLGGFRAGLSYADQNASNNNDTVSTGINIVSGGLEYRADLDGVALALSAVGENAGEGNWYGFGTNVGFGNFTVGASYGHTEDDYGVNERNNNFGLNDGGNELDAFDIGVSYAMDAASVSLSYGYEDVDGEGDISAIDLGLNYALGAGVAWKSSIFWFDQKADSNAVNPQDITKDNDGYGLVTGLALSF